MSTVFDSRITANLSPALTRGAGDGTVSVGSRCPRHYWCGGVNPSNPPHAAARQPASRSRAATLRSPALVKGSIRPRSSAVFPLQLNKYARQCPAYSIYHKAKSNSRCLLNSKFFRETFSRHCLEYLIYSRVLYRNI